MRRCCVLLIFDDSIRHPTLRECDPMRSILTILAAIAAPAVLVGQQSAKRAFTPADWYKLATLSAPAMSPDGGHVAFTVQTIDERDDKYHREVWVVPTAGGTAARFTSPSTESSNPRWSPDGKYLLFTSKRPGGHGPTWMLRMDQPGGEAFQMESYPRGTSFPTDGRIAVWSDADSVAPDSAARREDPYAKMPPMARPPYGAITKPLDPARFDGRHVYDLRYKSNDLGFLPGAREARRWRPAQIWVQAFDGSPRHAITETRYSHRNVVVSPNGQWVAFVADARLRPDSVIELERDSIARLPYDRKRDDVDRNEVDVYVLPITGGTPHRIASVMGNEQDIAWSPDSKRLAFIGRPGRMRSARVYVAATCADRDDCATPENILGAYR